MRKLLAFLTGLAILLAAQLGIAQVPPPVPALTDAPRLSTYSLSLSTCTCSVGFALYGDGTDYQDWVEVWLNGIRVNFNDPTFGWTITSPTGQLGLIALPITDAVLTFNQAQSGTVSIVGARRPRRLSQFTEGRGIAARDLNVALTDIIAENRETWDKINDITGRALISQPGNVLGLLPQPTACVNMLLGFDATGLNPVCVTGSGGGGGGTPPGGVPTDVQFNNSGTFGGDTGFTYFGNGAAFLGLAGTSTGKLGFAGASSGDIILQGPAAITTYNLVLPAAVGTTGQFLQGTVTGSTVTLGWATASGGSGSPGGVSTDVQFNNAGVFGGDTGFAYFGNGAASLGLAGTSTGILEMGGATAGTVIFQAPANISATYNLVLPAGFGTNGYLLQETLVGTTASLGWVSPTTTVNSVPCSLAASCIIPLIPGTMTITGGTNGDIEYNNAGILGEKAVTGTGNVVLATAPTMTSVTISSATSITGLPAPANPSDAATKAYVDATASGLVVHTSVQWATAAVLPNTPTYANGSSGVGATLTSSASTTLTVDGNTVNNGDRVLVKNQAAALQNGVYVATIGGSPWVLTRSTDFNAITSGFSGGTCTPAASCIAPDSYFFVAGGAVNANSSWILSNAAASTLTIGTTSITFSQFSSSTTYTAGTGLSLVGTQFSLASPYVNALTSSGGTINFTGTPSAGQIPIASSASTGVWTTLNTQPLNILSESGSNNLGTGDNTTAINNALTALTTPGECLYFPGGYYEIVSQISYTMPAGPSSLCIEGDALGASVLYWTGATGGFTIAKSSPSQSVHFRNVSMLTQHAGGGTAINITQSSPLADFVMDTIDHVLIGPYTNASSSEYWNTGIIFNDVSGTDVGDTTIYGPNCSSSCPTTLGIQYEGTASGKESIYHFLHHSILNQLTTGVSINAWTQGVVIDTVNIENGQSCTGGLSATCAAILIGNTCPAGDDRVQFVVHNSLIQNDFGGAGILVKCLGSTLQLTNNTFVGSAGNYDLLINAAFNFVQATNNNFSCGVTGTCVYSIGGWGQYDTNQLNSGSVGFNFPNTGAFNSERGNTFTSITTNLSDSQTSNPAYPWSTNSPLAVTSKSQQNIVTTALASAYGMAVGNTNGTSGAHGMTVQAGLNAATDSSSNEIAFLSGNGSNLVGYIGRTGSGVAYNTSSDIRRKENIEPTTHGLADLMRLPVREFNWRDDPLKVREQGFVAQEIYPIISPINPWVVHVGGDNPATDPWTVDYGRITPLLVQAIKELKAEVDDLRRRLH